MRWSWYFRGHGCSAMVWSDVCNMKGSACWGLCPAWYPQLFSPKENNTEDSVSYKADWPIRSSLLLANSHILINPFFWSILAMWLSTFFSGVDHLLLLRWPGQEWEESTSSFPEFFCSPCIIFTFCLVFLPTPPAWPISIYLKHDWQNTDNSLVPCINHKIDWEIKITSFLNSSQKWSLSQISD